MFNRKVEKQRENKRKYYQERRQEKIEYQRAYNAKKRLEKLNAPKAAAQEPAQPRRSSRLDPKKRENEVALVDDRKDKQIKLSADEVEDELPAGMDSRADVNVDADIPFYNSDAAFALLFDNNTGNKSDYFLELSDDNIFKL